MTAAPAEPVVDESLILTASDRQAVAEGCWFDEVAGNRPIAFIEQFIKLPDPNNLTKAVPMVLMDWQKDMIRQVWGWMRADGTRRFRYAWLEVPKKQGKSTAVAALILYMLIADGEPDAECYSAACTKEQASIIYRAGHRMIERSTALSKLVRPLPHVKRLIFDRTKSFYAVLPNTPGAVDGINASLIAFDEIHRQTNRELYNALAYAGAARKQPLQIILTTAGDDRDSIGWELHERAKAILQGSIIDTETFAFIAAADDEDDPGDPKTWAKANPSLGVTIREDELAAEYERARDSPARLQNFRRLRLNQWVTRTSRWLDYDRWAACPPRPPLEHLNGMECWGGLDLSSKHDLTALVLQFPTIEPDGQRHHAVQGFYWLPEANIEEQERLTGVPYRAWADMGVLELTSGDFIDFAYIRRRVLEVAEQYQLRQIAFDPAFAQQIGVQLIEDGLDCMEFWARPTMYNPPLRYLESAIIEGRLHHGDCPIMNWAAGNIEVVENVDGLIKPAKPNTHRKIDPIVALAMSVAIHCKTTNTSTTAEWEESPLVVF